MVLRACIALVALLLAFPLAPGSRAADQVDFRELDLSGEWYVLIHYKDKKSKDPSITKFKDFAWSVKQSERELTVEHYPYVLFNAGIEEIRRHAMDNHLPWEPDEITRDALRGQVGVSARAMTRERMPGSRAEGFRSEAASGGGQNTLTFSRNWEVRFAAEGIRIVIVDSLSGSAGLAEMDEAAVYELEERPSPDELRGRWREATKHGTVRLMRARERRIVK